MAADAAASGRPIIDARLDIKVSTCSGRDEDWFMWCMNFEAYTGLLKWSTLVEEASVQREPIDVETLGEEAKQVSLGLFNLLVSKCEGKALGLIRAGAKHHGLEVWRILKGEYESRESGREQSLAEFIMNPGDRWRDIGKKGLDFMQSLTSWEATIQAARSSRARSTRSDCGRRRWCDTRRSLWTT